MSRRLIRFARIFHRPGGDASLGRPGRQVAVGSYVDLQFDALDAALALALGFLICFVKGRRGGVHDNSSRLR